MNNFLELKKMVEAQNANSPLMSTLQRSIHEWERELFLAKLDHSENVLFENFVSSDSPVNLGPHNYSLRDYALTFECGEKSAKFIVTNLKANKSKPLKDCPDYIQSICLDHLPYYFELIAAKVDSTLETEGSADEL